MRFLLPRFTGPAHNAARCGGVPVGRRRVWSRAGCCALFAAALCSAATTQTWEMSGYNDFSRGKLNGLSVTREGRLVPGPQIHTIFDSGQADIWSVAAAPDGSYYLGTGNRGRLYRVFPDGKSALVWTSDQPEIFAVAVDAKGVVYAGTSPDGKIYRIENGKAAEYFSPEARYIWALAFAPDGSLYAGTGDEGKIFRVNAPGQGSIFYETGQSHVTALAFDPQGRLLAGSEPNGLLYRITSQGKAFVLYDSSLPEIRAIVPAPDGTIYAAALGGSIAKRVGAASAGGAAAALSAVPTITTTVTVTDQQSGINIAPKPEAPKASASSSAAQSTVTTSSATTEATGVERSALYKIAPDNAVETIWTSKDENIYDLALQGSSLVFVTDAQGRVYRMDNSANGAPTLVAQANEGDATRLLASSKGLLAATGSMGKLLRFEDGRAGNGWFESPVHDAGTVARWGRLSWRGNNAGVTFRTRTGNSARPDSTWSDWSEAISNPAQSGVSSPNARYIQWRAEFSGASGALDDVSVAYLPQNTPPVVRSINVIAVPSPAKAPASTSSSASYSVTVTDTPDGSSSASTGAQPISRGAGQQIQVSWQADDPDGDRLIYSLYFRGEEETQWKLLRANMTESTYTLDGDVLADGRYFFRVTASDRPSNPVNLAREAELVSAPVAIDNTPPVVTPGTVRKNGGVLELDVTAEDRASALRRCEYSVDAGPWTPVEAADGVTDSPRESFPIRLEGFPTGEHLLSIRVYDAAGNAGLAKVVVR
ncbi:MAG: hypothetical protein JO307_07955 [Bryobacterales bacterium]|nr:hypothetical protein [Bryobacterales bacterium]